MKKPKSKTVSVLDWSECVAYIEQKYGVNLRDYAGKFKGDNFHKPFLVWCDSKGYGEVDSEGNTRLNSTIFSSEHNREIESGIIPKPKKTPYLDFWHFLVDCWDVSNGCNRIFDVQGLIESAEFVQKNFEQQIASGSTLYDVEDKEEYQAVWKVEIIRMFEAEFGDGFEVEISW